MKIHFILARSGLVSVDLVVFAFSAVDGSQAGSDLVGEAVWFI